MPNNRKNNHKNNKKRLKVKMNFSWKNIILYGFLVLLFFFMFAFVSTQYEDKKQVPISKVIADVKAGKVKQISVSDNKITVLEKDGSQVVSNKEPGSNVYTLFKDAGANLSKTNVEVKDDTGVNNWVSLLANFLPVLIMFGFLYIIYRQARGAQDNIFSFGKSSAKVFSKDQPQITFDDVAGVDEAKQ